jgi:hypothetical protein
VVSGTVALMLQANPTLTPIATKAILQYTAQEYAGYDPLTEGAGFLDAHGAVVMARFFAAPATEPYPSDARWSRQLIWGNHRVRDGRLSATANAWSAGVTWGALTTPSGEPIAWGTACDPADCGPTSVVMSWGAACLIVACDTTGSSSLLSDNVVWGTTCGGADCPGAIWHSPDSQDGASGQTVVWGTTPDGETVVWGTNSSGETVVWGTSGDGETVVWGTNDGGETVVWGTSSGEDVVWPPPPCEDPSCGS